LIISRDDTEAVSLEQIRGFLAGSGEVRFTGLRRAEVYRWVERTLVRHEYAGLGRPGKGLVRQYVARMTGLSRAQVTRLIAGHRKTGRVKAAEYQRTKFATRYTTADVGLLAYVDKAHGNLSGPATKRILEREYTDYGLTVYERLHEKMLTVGPFTRRQPPALQSVGKAPCAATPDRFRAPSAQPPASRLRCPAY
jgi:hypothetical protein